MTDWKTLSDTEKQERLRMLIADVMSFQRFLADVEELIGYLETLIEQRKLKQK